MFFRDGVWLFLSIFSVRVGVGFCRWEFFEGVWGACDSGGTFGNIVRRVGGVGGFGLV